MIPAALVTHFDLIRSEVTRAATNAVPVGLGHHATTPRRKPRSEDVRDVHELRIMTDRTGVLRGTTTLSSVAHELGLRIAHL